MLVSHRCVSVIRVAMLKKISMDLIGEYRMVTLDFVEVCDRCEEHTAEFYVVFCNGAEANLCYECLRNAKESIDRISGLDPTMPKSRL